MACKPCSPEYPYPHPPMLCCMNKMSRTKCRQPRGLTATPLAAARHPAPRVIINIMYAASCLLPALHCGTVPARCVPFRPPACYKRTVLVVAVLGVALAIIAVLVVAVPADCSDQTGQQVNMQVAAVTRVRNARCRLSNSSSATSVCIPSRSACSAEASPGVPPMLHPHRSWHHTAIVCATRQALGT